MSILREQFNLENIPKCAFSETAWSVVVFSQKNIIHAWKFFQQRVDSRTLGYSVQACMRKVADLLCEERHRLSQSATEPADRLLCVDWTGSPDRLKIVWLFTCRNESLCF